MEKSNFNITLPSEYNGKEPIIIHELNGALPEAINMEALSIEGNIDAVSAWIKTRAKDPDGFKKDSAHILLDAEKKTISLVIDENYPKQGTKITGKFVINPELEKLKINTEQRYSPQQLASIIKLNRYYFADIEQHASVLKNLKNHDADITAKIKEHADDRGNSENSIVAKLVSNIDEKFTLNIALFKGSLKKVKFEVIVCLEIRDKGISIWLESPELKELTDQAIEEVFAAKQKEYEEAGFTVVVK